MLAEDHVGFRQRDGHIVVLYGDDDGLLTRKAVQYFVEGIARGDSLFVVATPEHWRAFSADLDESGLDSQRAVREGAIIVLDAEDVLAQIMCDGEPDAALFDAVVGAPIRALADETHVDIRVYGEMVGILWTAGLSEAAAQLELLWNDLRATVQFALFCAYPVDVFGNEFQVPAVDSILCAHSELITIDDDRRLEQGLGHGIDRVLGQGAVDVRPSIESNRRVAWARLPQAESTILWLRDKLPVYADEIVDAAHEYFRGTSSPP